MEANDLTLLLRSFDEHLDEDDRLRFEALLTDSAEARNERGRYTHLRAMVGGSRVESFAPGFADRVMRRTSLQAEVRRQRSFGWMDRLVLALSPTRLAGGLAVAVVAIAAVSVFFWVQPHSVSVPYGSTQVVELSDGTSVELSGGSTLTYQRFLGKPERVVQLVGEAFFSVATGDKPFIVETFNASIRVLGTRFNVRAWADEPSPETFVALAEGRLTVEPLGPTTEEGAPELALQHTAAPIVLEAGEATTISADSASAPQIVSLDRALAWRTGGFAVADRPLRSVFREIERRYDVEIATTNLELLHRNVTYLNPSPESAEEVLADICHTLDLQYRRTAGGFEVLPNE